MTSLPRFDDNDDEGGMSVEPTRKGRNFFDDDEPPALGGSAQLISGRMTYTVPGTSTYKPPFSSSTNSGSAGSLSSAANPTTFLGSKGLQDSSQQLRRETTASLPAPRKEDTVRRQSTPSGDAYSGRSDVSQSHPFTKAAESAAQISSKRRQSSMSYPQPIVNPSDAVRHLLSQSDFDNRRDSSFVVCLENFRSLNSKRKLLDEVTATHDGNAILTVLRFLKSTLDYDLFVSMLQAYPDVTKLYISYLKQLNNTSEISRLLPRLERIDTSAMSKDEIEGATKLAFEIKGRAVTERFASAVSEESDRKRKDDLNKFASREAGNLLAEYAKKVAILLEIQQNLDVIDAAESRKAGFMYTEFPLSGSVVGKTLGETLRHCAIYHLSIDPAECAQCKKKEPPIHMNAACLKKALNISEKVFQVAMVRALTQSRRYDLIDKVLASKGFAGFFTSSSKKVKPAVAPARVVDVMMFVLKKFNRLGVSLPSNINTYLQHVDDPDVMEQLAREYQLYQYVTEIYCQRRDRQRLMGFIPMIPSGHSENERARYRLRDPSIKWRN